METRTLGVATTSRHRRRQRRRAVTFALGALVILSGLSVLTGVAPSRATTTSRHSGSVDVLYAGSLLDLMQQQLFPAFHRATGYSVNAIANGSKALASEIEGGTEVGDVFISASPAIDVALHRASNGAWVSSFDEFATSSLVLGYNPRSKFAVALTTQPWYNVVSRPGFELGRTDPATDPKGVLARDALTEIGAKLHRPTLSALAKSTSNIFAETSMIGELQSGQLDAGFFYAVEASAAHLTTVPLVGVHLAGTYTVALLKNAPHPGAASAFVQFLLSAGGRRILQSNGLTPLRPPKVVRWSSSVSTTQG